MIKVGNSSQVEIADYILLDLIHRGLRVFLTSCVEFGVVLLLLRILGRLSCKIGIFWERNGIDKPRILFIFKTLVGPLTQSVEYQPFKLGVAGSSPARPILYSPHRLARSRTPAFHAGDRGSNPLGGVFLK